MPGGGGRPVPPPPSYPPSQGHHCGRLPRHCPICCGYHARTKTSRAPHPTALAAAACSPRDAATL
eukprot:7302643-Alexandrium_andersonii.AAC.1